MSGSDSFFDRSNDTDTLVATPTEESSPAAQRFQSCRWRKTAEAGTADHCTHRDVLPITGTSGFDAGAWCVDCGFYKIRRTPRKRPPEERYY